MPEPFSTMRFAIDRDSYMRAMWTRGMVPYVVSIGVLEFLVILALALFLGLPILLAFALPVLGMLFSALTLRERWRKNVFNTINEPLYGTRVVTFSDEGVHTLASTGIESKAPWPCFTSAERRGEFVLLFLGSQSHFMIPDRAFATPEDREAFFKLVEASVKLRAKTKLRALQ